MMVHDHPADRMDDCDLYDGASVEGYDPNDADVVNLADWLTDADANDILYDPVVEAAPAPVAVESPPQVRPVELALQRERAARAGVSDPRFKIRTSDPLAQRQYVELNDVPPRPDEPIVRSYDLIMPRHPSMGCALYGDGAALVRLIDTRPFSLDVRGDHGAVADGRCLVRLECAFLPPGCTQVEGALGGAPFTAVATMTLHAASERLPICARKDREARLRPVQVEHGDVVLWRHKRAIVAQLLCVSDEPVGTPTAEDLALAASVLRAWAAALLRGAAKLEPGPLSQVALVSAEDSPRSAPVEGASEKARSKRRMQ
jgi:hypothetical protein